MTNIYDNEEFFDSYSQWPAVSRAWMVQVNGKR